ncbi:ribonuclease H2 subunit A [Acrasis kona]|uniref:Ribonuclease n=1 Tax=Acrasis kona TaxID=1008807 RepID=A0AAW2YXJ2_9EUKA
MQQEYIMGIDEAGRGPVIGPMVYGAAYCKLELKDQILELFKVKDSKELTATQRDQIAEKLRDKDCVIGHFLKVMSADFLCQNQLSRQKYNLNTMSHDAAIELIQMTIDKLSSQNCVLKEVFVDTVGDPGKYQSLLQSKFPNIDTITVSKKADSLFPIVSAASIVAKVTRDEIVAQIEAKYGKMGSGHPSDPQTKKWLEANADKVFGYPSDAVRFSWATIKNALEKAKCAQVEWSDDEDQDQKQFKPKKATQPQCKFLETRGLQIVTNI